MNRAGPRQAPGRRSAILALLLLVPAPTIGLLVVLVGPKEPDGRATLLGQGIWAFSKLWIYLLPVLWQRYVDRLEVRIPRPGPRGMGVGLASGAFFAATILTAYATLGRDWSVGLEVAERISQTGMDRPWRFVLMAAYWCSLNSLLEEYVWRWFVFTRCEALMPRGVAVAASGLCFTIHHAVAMGVYFDDARIVVLASLGVWMGGATWSWIYLRWRNIYAAYLSHVLADLAIFRIGYRILFLGG